MGTIRLLPPLWKAFEGLPDPRERGGRRYGLIPMLMSATCAMLAGACGVTGFSEWTRSRPRSDLEVLGFDREGLPCAATYWLLFEKLDTVMMEDCLRQYFSSILENETSIAVDGKVLHGSKQQNLPPVRLLSAFGHRTEVVFHQAWVGPKSNEIDVIIPLLSRLELDGKLVTADAMHAQRRTADFLFQRGLTVCWS
jgi:hypothetical protein